MEESSKIEQVISVKSVRYDLDSEFSKDPKVRIHVFVNAEGGLEVPMEFVNLIDWDRIEARDKEAQAIFDYSKRNKDEATKLNELIEKRVARRGGWLLKRLFELADGVYVIDKVNGKNMRFYKSIPSLPAIAYLFDRILGKPTQKVESHETKEGVQTIEHIIKGIAGYGNSGKARPEIGRVIEEGGRDNPPRHRGRPRKEGGVIEGEFTEKKGSDSDEGESS